MKWIKTHHGLVEIIGIIVLCSFPLFYRLDALPLRQWDEAKNAVSAIEMSQNKNYIVRYYDGEPDYWGVKPPLLTWLQVISMNIFGMNEAAIRIPSACAALLTIFFIIWYFNKFYRKIHIGYISVLILVTSSGYIGRHGARTGDHDALLILFTTMIILLYYEFLTSPKLNNRLLCTIALAVFLAILTKGVTVLMILPGLLIITFILKSQHRIFYNKRFYLCLVSVLLLTAGYYLWREHLQPGYLKTVWNEELFPRYFNTNEEFDYVSFLYYGRMFFAERYSFWIYFLILSIGFLPFIPDSKQKRLGIFLFIVALSYFLIISAGTKNLWYDALLYPLFSTLIAIMICNLTGMVRLMNQPIKKQFKIWFVAALLIYPSYSIIKEVKRKHEHTWDVETYAISYVLRDWLYEKETFEAPAAIAFDGYYSHILFYTEALAIETGDTIPVKTVNEISKGDTILLSQQHIMDRLDSLFTCEVLVTWNQAKLIHITGLSDY